MRCGPRSRALRTALDFPDGTPIGHYSHLVEAAREKYSHTIKCFSESADGACVPYAFDLNTNPVYRQVATSFEPEIFADGQFINWMLRNGLHEVDQPALGTLALYFLGADWKHIGVVTGSDRVTSKWGEYPIYEHGLCEVPMRYGDRVRFFERPSAEAALDHFLNYARQNGVSDNDIADLIVEVGRGGRDGRLR